MMKLYSIEYPWNGRHYVIDVLANSPEEAMERLKQASAWGNCYTPHGIAAVVPAKAGFLVKLWCWAANLMRVGT